MNDTVDEAAWPLLAVEVVSKMGQPLFFIRHFAENHIRLVDTTFFLLQIWMIHDWMDRANELCQARRYLSSGFPTA